MKSARHQLILLGFLCQALTWDDVWMPLGVACLWLVCLVWGGGRPRFPGWVECLLMFGGCFIAYDLGRRLGRNTHFFIGHGITLMQAVRLGRPLVNREKWLSVAMACLQIGVGCTFLFDLRFLPVLLGLIYLLPKTLIELEFETAAVPHATSAPPPPRLSPPILLALAGITMAFFLLAPRGLVNLPLHSYRSGGPDEGTLLETMLDPTRGGRANSRQVVLQIEGDDVGYLRCHSLADFDGKRWSSRRFENERPIPASAPGLLDRAVSRRVHVKRVAYLDRVLPVDGHVIQIRGKFFNRALRSNAGTVQAEVVWNAPLNTYEYRTLLQSGPDLIDPLSPSQRQRTLRHPPPSDRVRAWLDQVLAGITEPEAQARRLESIFQRDFTYRLGAPELNRLVPLEDFLFNQRQGHCERFASALALLLRMQDIPSRVVVGYLPRPSAWSRGWHNVRFNDAHAWTEAYLPGRGWTQFDATPAAALTPGQWWDLADIWDTLDLAWTLHVANFDRSAQTQLRNWSLEGIAKIAGWIHQHSLGCIAVPGLLVFLALWGRNWFRLPLSHRSQKASAAPTAAAMEFYQRMLVLLARHGYSRRPPQTPLEFSQEIQQRHAPHPDAVAVITQRFCEARYGQIPVSPEAAAQISQAWQELRDPKS